MNNKALPRRSFSRRQRFLRHRGAVFGLLVFVCILAFCLAVPAVSPYSYDELELADRLVPFSSAHPMGTDNLGRDYMVRLAFGGRLTLLITLTAGLISAGLGSLIGILSGCAGGRSDALLMRGIDALASVPSLLLAIVAEFVLGWGSGSFRYGLAISGIPAFAKVMRAAVLEIMGHEYIEASRALGAGRFSTVFRHVLRNAAPTFFVQLVGCLAEMLVTCTVLGYLGIGVTVPIPEWGSLFDAGKDFIRVTPHLALYPALFIVFTALALHLIGNGLRDSFTLDGGAL